MPCPKKKDNPKRRKHTPIKSKKQRGLFGAEYARRKAGKKRRMKGITKKELKSHLEEAGGKKLPKKAKSRKQMERRAKKGLKKAFPDKKTGRHTGLVLPKKAKRR